jgi:hypothetical protein
VPRLSGRVRDILQKLQPERGRPPKSRYLSTNVENRRSVGRSRRWARSSGRDALQIWILGMIRKKFCLACEAVVFVKLGTVTCPKCSASTGLHNSKTLYIDNPKPKFFYCPACGSGRGFNDVGVCKDCYSDPEQVVPRTFGERIWWTSEFDRYYREVYENERNRR